MTDLITMMEQLRLLDAETEIQQQVQQIAGHANSMKQAVLLAILAEESLKQLDAIDITPFVEQLKKRLDSLHSTYAEKKAVLDAHRQQNATILKAIEPIPETLEHLETEAGALIQQYDDALRSVIENRERLFVENMVKPGPMK